MMMARRVTPYRAYLCPRVTGVIPGSLPLAAAPARPGASLWEAGAPAGPRISPFRGKWPGRAVPEKSYKPAQKRLVLHKNPHGNSLFAFFRLPLRGWKATGSAQSEGVIERDSPICISGFRIKPFS